MIEIRGDKKVLVTPVSAEDLADIKIGDIVWLDGDLMTCRDVAHRRLVEYGRELPYDVRNKAIFHAGPIVRKKEGTEDEYEMVSVGPTTSMRMEKFEYEFTQHTGVRVIVGKGGMGPNTERACKEFGAIHCVFPAGCAVVAATEVERIAEHHWDELGMPETLWCCKVKEFGPLIVSIDALNTQAVNATSQLQLGQGYVILQVCDRKAMIEKYTAAVIKKNVDFSQDTYRTAYNKFSSFVSANQTADEIVKNAAKSGYKVQDLKDITTATHYVANIHSTREALKWIFEAKEGSVSPMYECGNNDHLLVVVLDKINRIGFRGLDDPQVKEMVKAEVIKDKKAEMIEAKLNGVKNIAAAKSKGAKVSEVNQITFAAPVFVASAGASEPALSGAVSATKKGVFSAHPVKGNAGVYLFLVTNKSNRPVKFDEKALEQKCRQKSMQYAGNFMNELYLNANVVDNRYLFF